MVDTVDLTGLSSDSSDSSDSGPSSLVDFSHTQPQPQPSSINRPLPPSLESTNLPFRRHSPSSPRSSISRGPISPPPVRRTVANNPNETGWREHFLNRSSHSSTPQATAPTPAPPPVPAPVRASVPVSVSSIPGLGQAEAPIRSETGAPAAASFPVSTLPAALTTALAAIAAPSTVATSPSTAYIAAATTASHTAPAVTTKIASTRVSVPPSTLDRSSVSAKTNVHSMVGMNGNSAEHENSQKVPTQWSPGSPRARRLSDIMTPKGQTFARPEWDVDRIEDALNGFRRDIRDDHSQMTGYIIDSVEAREHRRHSGADLFANVSSKPVAHDEATTVKVKFKQHGKNKDAREEHHPVLCIKTDQERVPPYRNHYVETKKNVLTPGTMLTYVPHVRDLDSSEEAKYNDWLKELEQQDQQSGFQPLDSNEKLIQKVRAEIVATVSLYLEKWLDDLSLPGLDKSALIRYTFREETAFTPRQRTSILKSHNEAPGLHSTEGTEVARMFTEAFHRVFGGDNHPAKKRIELRMVLLLDEAVENILEPRPKAKDGAGDDEDDDDSVEDEEAQRDFDIDNYLERYWNLSCAICFSNACDHGEYNRSKKEAFTLPGQPEDKLWRRKRRNRGKTLDIDTSITCRRQCHRTTTSEPSNVSTDVPRETWTEDEHMVLRTLHATLDHSKVRRDPFCVIADFLNRDCCDVYREFQGLSVIDDPVPEEPPRKVQLRNITWYDRYKKALIGDWMQHTDTHDHTGRTIPEPCAHEGPCTQETCRCVQLGALCEKFCECTAECCVYKFTGCACHSQGKTCISKQKDRPCICLMLSRECDPDLCGSCGVLERAQPENAEDDTLHSKGCQNCVIQRGHAKTLVLGESQLQGCGYGLFTAVDIAQDEFVIEYVGEVITQDEGIRREQRRGDVFKSKGSVSYLFTLLEADGLWVDAATYGNLSRYINHAPPGEVRGCNITPNVVFVNAEYRIKFTALRNIKAGEELFFNYGEHFPHLTEKLMDEGEKGQHQPKKRGRRPKQPTGEAARKTSAVGKKKPGKAKASKTDEAPDPDDDDIWVPSELPKARKRKHGLEQFEEDDYQPTGTEATGSRAESPATIDSDEPMAQSLERLRKRTRRVKSGAPATPENHRGQPKTRGKRGGARPGSGRPRKHPRPAPKPASATEESKVATSQPAPTLVTAPKQSSLGLAHSEEEAEHSDEDRYHSVDDEDDDEDDDDDQDVVIRKRQGRTARSRRPPAKFRDDESAP